MSYMSIVRESYRPLPNRLYHFTRGDAAFSIISGGKGLNEEICFWLKNAQTKNDETELKLGAALTDRLKAYMHEHGRSSLFNEIIINPGLVFINSFTEGEGVSDHMLEEYGNFRLEFDFRGCRLECAFRECSYFEESDIDELTACYCSTFDRYWPRISGEEKDINALFEYLREGMSAVMSIPLLKHRKEWEMENEWRQVFHRQPVDNRVFSMRDESPRMKVYYPATSLVGVTCYVDSKNKGKTLPYYYKIKEWVKRHGWKTKVSIVGVDG